MAFEVVTAVEPEYVRITAFGEYSLEDLYSFIDQIKAEAEKAFRKTVLVDSRGVKGNMTDADRFFAGRRIAELFGSRLKAAVVMPENGVTKLGESVAVSRGAKLLVTESEQEALDWLLSD
jgi:hypothetical protein